MSTEANAPSPETTKRLATLAARAMDLDAIFACGGEAKLPAPLALRGPKGKRLVIDGRASRSPSTEKQLRAWCAPAAFGDGAKTRTDMRVRDGHQLYARDGALAVEGLDEALRAILGKVRQALCPFEASPPIAELHSLNVYRRGGHFVAHKDTPRDPGVFGTLVVCLPLPFSGGRLIVEQESRAVFDWETYSYTFRRSDEEALRVRWAAFFGDVDHRIETVTSGCRATLTYELRRAPAGEAIAAREPGAAEAAFTAALVEALADPRFLARGGKLGLPCLHLYALPTDEGTLPGIGDLRQDLKGRDRLVADALARAGIEPRVVPYVFETCAGDSWRLRRGVSAREKEIFTQKQLEKWDLEDTLPIEFHADYKKPDDVRWLVRPPWVSAYREPADGRPEPARELLGEVEYSVTGYFGNEAGDAAFYAVAAIVVDVPSAAARRRFAAER